MTEHDPDVRRYRANLQGEVDGATVYDALADASKDPAVADVYRRLAAVERAHAEFWREHLARKGAQAAKVDPSLRARSLAFLARRFGPAFILPVIAEAEARDGSHYDDQPEAVAGGLPEEERGHARLVRAASAGGGLSGEALAKMEGRHRGGAGNVLRASVLGANDGLVSNLSLVMGIAGAAAEARTILLTGLAGLLAGACSMAMGEWLSVTSARELAQRQIAAEADELELAPDEEQEELVLLYRSKGLDEASARTLAERLFSDRKVALDALAREELGIDPESLGGSAWAAAGWSFMLFALGAVFPVAPFFFTAGATALATSAGLSGLALAGIGAATSLFTGRSALFCALRQLGIGYGAALITYLAGRAVGVSLG